MSGIEERAIRWLSAAIYGGILAMAAVGCSDPAGLEGNEPPAVAGPTAGDGGQADGAGDGSGTHAGDAGPSTQEDEVGGGRQPKSPQV